MYSKGLVANSDVVRVLKKKLGQFIVGLKADIGAQLSYGDMLEIANLLNAKYADCLLCIGSSSSYSDACKTAHLMQANFDPATLTPQAMKALVNQDKGKKEDLKDP